MGSPKVHMTHPMDLPSDTVLAPPWKGPLGCVTEALTAGLSRSFSPTWSTKLGVVSLLATHVGLVSASPASPYGFLQVTCPAPRSSATGLGLRHCHLVVYHLSGYPALESLVAATSTILEEPQKSILALSGDICVGDCLKHFEPGAVHWRVKLVTWHGGPNTPVLGKLPFAIGMRNPSQPNHQRWKQLPAADRDHYPEARASWRGGRFQQGASPAK